MKIFSKIVLKASLLILLFSATSCLVLAPNTHHDNGKHKGWYKNSHFPPSVHNNGGDNHGHDKNKSKNKGKSKHKK